KTESHWSGQVRAFTATEKRKESRVALANAVGRGDFYGAVTRTASTSSVAWARLGDGQAWEGAWCGKHPRTPSASCAPQSQGRGSEPPPPSATRHHRRGAERRPSKTLAWRSGHITPTGSSRATGCGVGVSIVGRRSESAMTGNRTAETSPAAMNAEAVAGVSAPMSTPIIDAVTMKGNEVAW